ncbi:MAG: hypothetical protein WC907_01175 [Acholeplasmataceae bacterium]
MKKKISIILLSLSLILLTIPFFFSNKTFSNNKDWHHNLDYTYKTVDPENYIFYSDLRPNITNQTNFNLLLNGKKVMFETANDLYNWSRDLSYKNNNLTTAKKNELASLDYVLGQDIDYSVMKSQRFMPVGYSILGDTLKFSGTLDGRGFEIKNLYLVVFDEYYYIDEEDQSKTPSFYFSMFSYNEGEISNMGLIDPIIDLENEHPELRFFSYLVGENNGLVENVYVEDTRGEANGGIRAKVSKVNIDNMKSASGIIHTNTTNGILRNSYFAGESVVNLAYENLFFSEPIIYLNNGLIDKVSYANIYLYSSNNGNVESNLKISSNYLDDNWNFYQADGYPKLFGLELDNNNYIIKDSLDLVYFSKLVSLITIKNNIPFSESHYLITNDINLKDVARGAYKTPNLEFKGTFKGEVDINNQYSQINDLTINTGIIEGDEVYFGLFSKFSGTISNLAFYNAKITPNKSLIENYTNSNYFIGIISGKLINAEANNLFINGEINLDNTNVGAFSLGSLAGEASGNIENILFDGNSLINGGSQNYANSNIKNNFYMGGIIGKSGNNKLKLYNIYNKGSITSLNATLNNSNDVNYYLGGVIGYINNTQATKHELGLISNDGSITANAINSNRNINYYLAGVIGYSSGANYIFNSNYGKWINNGSFNYQNLNVTNSYIAGILNSNHNENIEFVQIKNNNDLINNNNYQAVSTLVNHLSSSNLTISQAISMGNYNITNNKSAGIAIYLLNNNPTLQLNYVEVYNNITFNNSINSELSISGITLHENTNLLNVVYGGDIDISTTSGSGELWVSGLLKVLNSGYYIKNSINEGDIKITHSSSGNLYVSGILNRNLSGDLHSQDNNIRPKATLGLLNSINLADIDVLTTTTSNSFIGGLVSLIGGPNGGTIQDAVNTGNITARNSSNQAFAEFSEDDNTGGVVDSYSGGIVVGGVVSTITNGLSRIYDTSNNGEIIGISRAFVRSGGILASALLYEIVRASNTSINISGISSNHFSNITNDNNNQFISNAIVSNGINYGDVQAATQLVASYSSNNNTATEERPGINASAGGVIGYGLTIMKNMINHGNISSTDVAGGVVGATMAYASASGATVTVNINTAINYGSIRAINNSNYNTVYNNKKATNNEFYPVNSTWITPNLNRTTLRRTPAQKRGFGGVFGRLQRARSRYMSSDGVNGSFDFVVNMDPNVDLIGRLDQVQNYTSSLNYFIFINAKYYSAKTDDNTQTVFTGEFRNGINNQIEIEGASGSYVYSNYRRTGSLFNYSYYRDVTININTATSIKEMFTGTLHQGGKNKIDNYISNLTHSAPVSYFFSDQSITRAQFNANVQSENFSNLNTTIDLGSYQSGTISKNVPVITENEQQATDDVFYVYDDDFEMRKDTTLLDNGEPITSYIYYAPHSLLAPHFKQTRPNGMYVLSSSSGSNYGSVLPKNFDLVILKKMGNDNVPNNLDYNNVSSNYLVDDYDPSFNLLLNEYKDLYQTEFNEKSALLKDNQSINMKDNNYNTNLFYYNISFVGYEIIFKVNQNLINQNSSFTFDFEILNAVLPEGALIAKDNADQSDLENFRNNNPSSLVATNTLAPDLSYYVSNRNNILGQTITVGTFTSYSEAAINNANFISLYKTEYTVKLEIENINRTKPSLYRVSLDNNAFTQSIGGTHTITENIGLEFRENSTNINQHLLQNGFIINDYIQLYYTEGGISELVDKSYYQIISIPKNGRDFQTRIHLSNNLRHGNYQIRYKFFENDTYSNLNINYTPNRIYDFLEFKPFTSQTFDGTTADYMFDYDLLANIDNDLFNREINSNVPIYNKDYYNYDIYFLENFIMSDFFEFDTINHSLSTDQNGYITHEFEFRLNNSLVTTKYVKERELAPIYYKDGSSIPFTFDQTLNTNVTTTTAKREAITTIFTVDYRLDNAFYNPNDFEITYKLNNVEYSDDDYSFETFNNNLNIYLTNEAPPGEYTIEITYLRDSYIVNAGLITVTKLEGTSGYLSNIKFSRFVVGNEYSNLNVVGSDNSDASIDSNYNMNIYYNGIDYNDSDRDSKKYFRIDGTVARIPLNDYSPVDIVDFLPIGSKIKRKTYDEFGNPVWSELVDKNNTESEIAAALNTDFTIDPKTGEWTGELVYIEYMVVPENELYKDTNDQNGITYFISVVDVDFTFLAIFNYWFDDGTSVKRIENETSLNEKIFVLNIYNYLVESNNVLLDDETIYELNEFDQINFDKINKIESKVSMFYYINDETKDDYIYQLGNNLSGYYHFKLSLPKNYSYRIYLNDYNEEENLLPTFNSKIEGYPGYFYYINTSSITRTRYFHVVVKETIDSDDLWGLNDYNNTWSNN